LLFLKKVGEKVWETGGYTAQRRKNEENTCIFDGFFGNARVYGRLRRKKRIVA
jgi:hypothetical protein